MEWEGDPAAGQAHPVEWKGHSYMGRGKGIIQRGLPIGLYSSTYLFDMLSEQLTHLLMAMDFSHIQCSCIALERMTHTIQHCNTPHCREVTLSFRRALAPALSSRLVVATSPSLAAKNSGDQPVFCREREGKHTVYTQVSYTEHTEKPLCSLHTCTIP